MIRVSVSGTFGFSCVTGETFVTHRYQTGGTYPVRATQSNANGSTNTATLVVIVP